MATVEIRPETYAALQALAASKGSTVAAMVQLAVQELLQQQDSSGELWLARWRAVQDAIQATMPEGITAEEIEADIDEAIREVRAERRARGN